MPSTRTIVAAVLVLSFVVGSAAVLQPAFAHAHATLTLEDEPVAGKEISMTVGHANEPAYGVESGIHDGKHGLQISISDAATELPLSGAGLKADKYYFKDIRSFERADSLEDADAIEKGVDVGSVFGEPGQYLARQLIEPGIYGYRVYGTVDYFGVSSIPIDTTTFCSSADGDTTRFNSPEWSGSFGCPSDIDDSAFPGHGAKDRDKDSGAAVAGKGEIVAANAQYAVPEPQSMESQGWDFGTLLLAMPVAALAGVLGWKSLKRKGNGH